MKYIKGLDFLRACAVIFVIISHWFEFHPESSALSAIRYIVLPTGAFGVYLFFVLSGFLITSILLKAKQHEKTKLGVLKKFVVRRVLRIFPVYYFFLLLLFLVRYPLGYEMGYLKYYLTYTSNFLIMKVGNTTMGPTWSLSVEEQFYLVWPWLILFCSNKTLKYIIWVVIIAVPVVKTLLTVFGGYSSFAMSLFPLSCFDAFGIGGLYALLMVSGAENSFSENIRRYLPVLLFFYFAAEIIKLFSWWGKIPANAAELIDPLFRTVWAFVSIALIDIVIKLKSTSKVKILIENKYILWIGKISYGLYLFHYVLPYFFKHYVWPKLFAVPYLCVICRSLVAENTIMFIFLVLFTSCSYIYFERPVMKLKDRFSYD